MTITKLQNSKSDKMILLTIITIVHLPFNGGINIEIEKEKMNHEQLDGNEMRYTLYSN